MMLDVIASLGGLVIPPVFDFVKKKFLGSKSDSPKSTLNTLAVSKPEIMPDYIKGYASLLEAEAKYFNRDVIGSPSLLIVNLRAAIRPTFVIMTVFIMFLAPVLGLYIPEDVRVFMEMNISSWFGSRL